MTTGIAAALNAGRAGCSMVCYRAPRGLATPEQFLITLHASQEHVLAMAMATTLNSASLCSLLVFICGLLTDCHSNKAFTMFCLFLLVLLVCSMTVYAVYPICCHFYSLTIFLPPNNFELMTCHLCRLQRLQNNTAPNRQGLHFEFRC